MSWEIVGLVSSKRVGSQARRMLLISMADKANDDGSGVYASFQTLASMCECSRATVKRLVKDFCDEGLIHHVGMKPCVNGMTNEFNVVIDAIMTLPPRKDKEEKPAAKARRSVDRVHSEPGSRQISAAAHRAHQDPTTRVTMTPKPILKPTTLFGSKEPQRVATPQSKKPNPDYTPEFEIFWTAWPSKAKANSAKAAVAKKWKAAIGEWDADTIMRAAKRYLSNTTTTDDHDGEWKPRTCMPETFLNGKLETAVEAVLNGKTKRVWSSADNAFVEREV